MNDDVPTDFWEHKYKVLQAKDQEISTLQEIIKSRGKSIEAHRKTEENLRQAKATQIALAHKHMQRAEYWENRAHWALVIIAVLFIGVAVLSVALYHECLTFYPDAP